MLVDRFGRHLGELRIIVNMECNLRCIYCHREGIEVLRHEQALSPQEYQAIAEVAVRLGIEKFKLTGGEPLLQRNIVDIVRAIANVKPGDLSMTTNGVLLNVYAQRLAEEGLKRVNVSLPTLNKEKYRLITNRDALEEVINGIRTAYDVGLKPITLNVVVLRGVTKNEYEKIIDFASSVEGRVRLIELEPFGMGRMMFELLFEPVDSIVEQLEEKYVKKYTRSDNARPVYVLSNGVEVEIIKWYRNSAFCLNCHKIRLVFDGTLRSCIATSEGSISILDCLRPKKDELCLEKAFNKINELRKPFWSFLQEVSRS